MLIIIHNPHAEKTETPPIASIDFETSSNSPLYVSTKDVRLLTIPGKGYVYFRLGYPLERIESFALGGNTKELSIYKNIDNLSESDNSD